nr:MAG TPA: HOLLIDAY JUNCTION RESOLVASE [Caudoviricetes sp.]
MPRGKKGTAKVQRNSFKEVPCIIALDQSYTRTGLSICVCGRVRRVSSIPTSKYKDKTQKRLEVIRTLNRAIDACLKHYPPEQIAIIVERVRTFTGSQAGYHEQDISGNFKGLRPNVIKAHAALIACIVDTAYIRGIKTYSIETRSWKKAVLGSSKPIFDPIEGVDNPQKFGSVRKAIELGFEKELRVVKRGKGGTGISYNDDMADAICMSLYPFTGYPYHLELEQ